MRASLALDPTVLAMPALANDEEGIAAAIEALIELSRSVRSDECDIRMIQESVDYLAKADLYPVPKSIQKSIEAASLSHVYSTEDIRRAIQHILDRARPLEEISKIEFFVPTAIVCNPDVIAGRPAQMVEALELTLTHTAFAGDQTHQKLVKVMVAMFLRDDKIEFQADIDDIVPQEIRGNSVKGYASDILTCASFASFIEKMDADLLWSVADTDGEFAYAIGHEARKIRKVGGCPDPIRNCEKFILGEKFLTSLDGCQAKGGGKYAGSTLSCCASVVARSPTFEAQRMFRSSATGDRLNIQRSDGAKAWRVHVTGSGSAIRLMFWRLDDGSIEFANIGPKGELEIH